MQLKHFEYKEISWHGDEKAVKEFFDLPCETVVKENPQRLVVCRGKEEEETPLFYMKEDKSAGWRNRFKLLFRNRLRQEFDSGVLLQEAGIPVVEHVALGVKGHRSFLITRAFEGRELFDFWSDLQSDQTAQKKFLSRLCEFLVLTFDKSFFHPDLHGGNVMVSTSDDDFQFSYVDVYGVKKKRLSPNDVTEMLVFLAGLTKNLTKRDQKIYFSYFKSFFPSTTVDEIIKRVFVALYRRGDKFRRSRQKKYLRKSSQVNVWDSKTGRVVAKKSCSRDVIDEALSKFEESDYEVLKDDKKRRIFRIVVGERSFVVKHFLKPHFWGRWRSDARSWLNSIGMQIMKVPVVEYAAWCRCNDGSGIVVMNDGGRLSLYNTIKQNDKRSGQLLQKAGCIVGQLHLVGIYHNDLKMSNFIVTDDHDVKLVDLDDVKFGYDFKKITKVLDNLSPFLNHLVRLWCEEKVDKNSLFRLLIAYCNKSGVENRLLLELVVNEFKDFAGNK